MERYEKIRVLGQGAFGKVFLCKRRVDKSLIVIKQITVDELQTEDRRAAMNEVHILSVLKHPNIIAYYDSFVEDKSLMIVMEYAPGGTLFEFIQERNGRLLEEEHILQFFAQLVVAIEHVHSLNILHRDLKTQNIMLNRKKKVLKIGDFGISKVLSTKITSAQTVVGTPSYISPEICEGKLYKKKSDIWALGCLLYELTTLKKAFEGPNLSALVLKIMQGLAAVVPVDSRYSKGLRELIHSQLQRNPDDRPSIESIMATPIMVNTLVNLCTDIGRLPCSRSVQEPSASGDVSERGHLPPHCTRMGSLGQFRQRSFFEDDYQMSTQETGVKVVAKPQVYYWGDGVQVPTILPSLPDSQIMGVGAGRMQRAGITEDGKLVFWEQSSGSLATTRPTMQKAGVQKREPATFVPRLVGVGISAVIKKVACGAMYTAFLTNTGILMTFGSGVNGCLGHGDCDDVTEPKMVEGLLKFETSDLACGLHHMMAITTENTVYTWGKGDSGQLGLGSHNSHCSPQLVPLPVGHTPLHASCGTDSSLLVTSSGDVLATGCNRHNKLALDFQKDEIASEGAAHKEIVDGKRDQATSPNTLKLRASPLLSPTTNSETQVQEREETPPILNLIGETSDLMSSSLILSSIKRRNEGHSWRGDGCGSPTAYAPPSSSARRGTVGEVVVFQPSGSSLLKSETILSAAVGTSHTAFVTASGGCITCGDNGCGQLGRRCEKGDRNPAVVTSLRGHKVEKVACGDFFTAAATADGEVWCWGKGKRGRLGRELEEDSFDPQMVTFEQQHTVQSLACSHTVTLLLATPKS